MLTTAEYGLLAASAYFDIRTLGANRAPLPVGWTALTQFDRRGSESGASADVGGFSARVFQSGSGELVIAFAGTDFRLTGQALEDWFQANLPLSGGSPAIQAREAARLYEEVKQYAAQQGLVAPIEFTGHSLGGGLAALMGVYFNRRAVVFADAPFREASTNFSAPLPFVGGGSPPQRDSTINDLRTTLGSAFNDSDFSAYSPSEYSARASRIESHTITGEILSVVPMDRLSRVGSLQPRWLLQNGSSSLGALARHGIDLHIAAAAVPQFDAAAGAIRQALPVMFDSRLYGAESTSANPNFMVQMLRNQFGVRSETNSNEQTRAPNQMLEHLAADLVKFRTALTASAASTVETDTLQSALLGQLPEWYFWQSQPSASYTGQEFYTANGGLLQYATATGDAIPSAENRANANVLAWLRALEDSPFRNAAADAKLDFEQWNVVVRSGGESASARDDGRTQIFIGNGGSDAFTGGAKNDLLWGGVGIDTLDRGEGNDRLYGGAGADTYQFNGHFGTDVVEDSDGSGSLRLNGAALAGGRSAGVIDTWVQRIDASTPSTCRAYALGVQ